MAIFAEFNT